MAYSFAPTRVTMGNTGAPLNTEEWRKRMGEIGNEASQGAINSFERSSIDLANQAAANEARGLANLSQANTGFANDAGRLALQNQFMLENRGQATAAQNALANQFETQRQAALGLNLSAQQAAAQNALAQWQGNEEARRFNENFNLESASNYLGQQTQTQANENAIRQWELANQQRIDLVDQFNKTFGLQEKQANYQMGTHEATMQKLMELLAGKTPPPAANPPGEVNVVGGPTGSTEGSTSSGSTTFTKTPTGQTIAANPPTGAVTQPAPQAPINPTTVTPELQVQTYTGAKGLIQTLGRNVKNWDAFMARAAKQLNVSSLQEILTQQQLADVKTKFNLFMKRAK